MKFRENTFRFSARPTYHKWFVKCIIRIAIFFKTKQSVAEKLAKDVFGHADDLLLNICYPLLTLVLFSEIHTNPLGPTDNSRPLRTLVSLDTFHEVSRAESNDDVDNKLSNIFDRIRIAEISETKSGESLNEFDVELREVIGKSMDGYKEADVETFETDNGGRNEFIDSLYNSLMETDFETFASEHPLHIAAATHDAYEVSRLLEEGADVNKKAPEKYNSATPLMWASVVGAFWCQKFILSLDDVVEVNQTDNDGNTALDYLVRSWWNITYEDVAIFQFTLKLLSLNFAIEGCAEMEGKTNAC